MTEIPASICTYSNQYELLYTVFKQKVQELAGSPFKKRIVILPSKILKSFLSDQIAHDADFGVAFGFEFLFLDNLSASWFERASYESLPSTTSHLEKALKLNFFLRKKLETFESLQDEEKKAFKALNDYLGVDFTKERARRRLHHLCLKLAHLFSHYQLLGPSFTKKRRRGTSWQEELWWELFHEEQTTLNLLQLLKQKTSCQDIEVHLFGFNFLPSAYLDQLLELQKRCFVHFYILSPTYVFWSDILSKSEKNKLLHYWRQKQAPLVQRQALEEFLSDTNPLLANWGRLGRHWARQWEIKEIWPEQVYQLPACMLNLKEYEPFIDSQLLQDDSLSQPTLLNCLQADLLLVRNPQKDSPIELVEKIPSIQIHQTTSCFSEVRVLYNQLIEICKADPSLRLSQIIVMAPQINTYVPYIKAVFEQEGSPFVIKITDIKSATQNLWASSLKLLLELAESRWESFLILQLLQTPAFCQKHDLNSDDLGKLEQWINQTKVQWAEDGFHRQELFDRCYEGALQDKQSSQSTWSYSFERLLGGLACLNHSQEETKSLGICCVNLTDAALLGKWIVLLKGLKADLTPLIDDSFKTIQQWCEYCQTLLQVYFGSNLYPDEEWLQFMRGFDEFKNLEATLPEPVSFAILRPFFIDLLSEEKSSYNEYQLQAITFSSLKPSKAIPAKVICLLGMNEGAYPRKEDPLSFDMSLKEKGLPYLPGRADQDRWLFLEQILCCRQFFLLSYVKQSFDNKEGMASIVISELLSYLNAHYTLNGANFKQSGWYDHPLHPYHYSYFQKGPYFNFSQSHYQEAVAYYKNDKEKSPPLLQWPPLVDCKMIEVPSKIDLKELLQTAKNPLRTYFTKRLHIYLEEEKEEQIWTLSTLQRYLLKKEALTMSATRVLEKAKKEGRFPCGFLGDVAQIEIETELKELHSHAEKWHGHSAPFQFFLSSKVKSPLLSSEGVWQIPAPICTCFGQSVSIIGRLSLLYPQGLLLLSKSNKETHYRQWPAVLILNYLHALLPEKIKTELFFPAQNVSLKAFVPDFQSALSDFMSHHIQSLYYPSLLIPEWIDPIYDGDAVALQLIIKQQMGQLTPLFNKEMAYLFQRGDRIDGASVIAHERQKAMKLYQPLKMNIGVR